jgi:hypothetical protein
MRPIEGLICRVEELLIAWGGGLRLPNIDRGSRKEEKILIADFKPPIDEQTALYNTALYNKASELYISVRHNPAGSEQDCVKTLASWVRDQDFSGEELTKMKAVFEERERRNNEGSIRGGALCASLCSESSKNRWILRAIAEALH